MLPHHFEMYGTTRRNKLVKVSPSLSLFFFSLFPSLFSSFLPPIYALSLYLYPPPPSLSLPSTPPFLSILLPLLIPILRINTHVRTLQNQQANMDLNSEENTNSQLVEPKMEPKMEQTSEDKPNTSDLPKNQIVPEPDTLVAVKKEVEDNEETEEQLGEPELNPRKKQKKGENHKN